MADNKLIEKSVIEHKKHMQELLDNTEPIENVDLFLALVYAANTQ